MSFDMTKAPPGRPSGAAKALWLHILEAGDWLSIAELRDQTTVVCSNLPATVMDMADNGLLKVRKRDARTNEYTVTSTCRVARDVTVKELLEATAFKPETAEG